MTAREAEKTPALPLIAAFEAAAGCGARADMLLAMPLAIVAAQCGQLARICVATGFSAGRDYCEVVTALTASRRVDGALDPGLLEQFAAGNAALRQLADAWRPVAETEGVCRAGRTIVMIGDVELPVEHQPDWPRPNPHCTCPPTRAARKACPAWRWT